MDTLDVFERLYPLRNQLVHGCATWNGRVNRISIKLMDRLVPTIICLIMKVPGRL